MNNKLTDKITKAAKEFTDDYFKSPGKKDYAMIENAMLTGAQIALQDVLEDDILLGGNHYSVSSLVRDRGILKRRDARVW